jgi:hypothetical protein
VRIFLRENGNRYSSADLYILLNQLRIAGIRTGGAGRIGEQGVILIDDEKDVDRAIAMLATIGITVAR